MIFIRDGVRVRVRTSQPVTINPINLYSKTFVCPPTQNTKQESTNLGSPQPYFVVLFLWDWCVFLTLQTVSYYNYSLSSSLTAGGHSGGHSFGRMCCKKLGLTLMTCNGVYKQISGIHLYIRSSLQVVIYSFQKSYFVYSKYRFWSLDV